ncbi:cytidine deaminase [Macrococcus brunensis]|uniref:Cytidine deaminase n=1 Tax=Macrococcus brunensis TaxID=198483 RepID=A0A4R6BEA1_9STAP|nr:cytidine deaminase [Macrococcus brunensis]TDL98140.1 cytidine deaminase [Macrococcus brunensis]ULG71125.1 cytidine deaminase [Macrococcus brunensis]ULG73460.1 cytidine deaminase [Macrococcus brunensis]
MEFKQEWYEEVRNAQKNAYTPYSKFNVGAYLVAKDGTTFHGCNVENAAYGEAICAERTALVSAIAKGYRPGDFAAIVVTTDTEKPSSPCGACRQVINELCDDDMPVFMTNHTGDVIERTVADLLPLGFSGKDLN